MEPVGGRAGLERAGLWIGRSFADEGGASEEGCAFARPFEAVMKPRCFGAEMTWQIRLAASVGSFGSEQKPGKNTPKAL